MRLNPLICIIFTVILESYSLTDYLVETGECKIPNFPVDNDQANVVRQDYTSCPGSDSRLFKTYTVTDGENTTKLIYRNRYETPPTCCYSYVIRNGSEDQPDVGISTSDCISFNDTVQLEGDVVKVKCEFDNVQIYENVHSPIYITESVRQKFANAPPPRKKKKISVLLVVIDSISRLNFHRTMSSTANYLHDIGFNEFVGYNKVDDNTFPNAMALLSGMNLKQVYSKCNPNEVGKLDECSMVWYDFRDLGYATAYAEDWVDSMTFNYLKKGFQNPPTDYYFKPYMEAAETLNTTFKDYLPYCAGPETEGERVLKLAKDFAVTFKDKPSFGIFWMNTFSHNNISSPSGMDRKVKTFFQSLRENSVLDKSIVILMSDHGIRFGNFRQTIQGWFEERLPILTISIPPWMKRTYSEEYMNFKNNSNKLVSTYDLYMTLQDILEMSVKDYNVSSSLACPKCQSLFSDIPDNRSCRQAGIPEPWCTCVEKFTEEDPRINEETNDKAKTLALREIKILEQKETFGNLRPSSSVTAILSSAVNLNRQRKSYLLYVIKTDSEAIYQVFFRIRGDPVEFVRIVKIIRLYIDNS